MSVNGEQIAAIYIQPWLEISPGAGGRLTGGGAVIELAPGESHQFTHTALVFDDNWNVVANPSIDTSVTWSIRWGPGAAFPFPWGPALTADERAYWNTGSITPDGLYTAPAVRGQPHTPPWDAGGLGQTLWCQVWAISTHWGEAAYQSMLAKAITRLQPGADPYVSRFAWPGLLYCNCLVTVSGL